MLIPIGIIALVALPMASSLGWLTRAEPVEALLAQLDASLAGGGASVLEARVTGLVNVARVPIASSALPALSAEGQSRSVAFLEAVRAIETHARSHETPASRAALGVARLVAGDVNGAVAELEAAAGREPSNGRILSDLAAAYLTRAGRRASAEDLVSALSAASRSLRLDPRGPESAFNRALALERLHLTAQAIEAWTALLTRESSEAHSWTGEITERRSALMARARPHDAGDRDNQALREHIEDTLLPAWGRARLARAHDRAAAALREAATLAASLVAAGGGRMPFDEVARVARLVANESAAPASATQPQEHREHLDALARGHDLFGLAREAYRADEQQRSAQLLAQAEPLFARAGSPYARWAPVMAAVFQRNRGDRAGALATLAASESAQLPRDYYHLRGRAAWAHGVILYARGRFDLGRLQLRDAVAAYRAAGEGDNLAATRTILAEADWVLGDHANAWRTLVDVLQALDARGVSKRSYHFWLAASLADDAGLHDAALELESAYLQAADSPRARAEAHVRRSRRHQRLAQHDEALSDLEQATREAAAIGDAALRERNLADVRIALAEALVERDPRRAIAEADAAVPYIARANPAQRLGPLLVTRATAREQLRDDEGARRDLAQAIDTFEQKRSALLSPVDRVQAFNAERAAYKRLICLETVVRGDPATGLRLAARARGASSPSGGAPVPAASSVRASSAAASCDPAVPFDPGGRFDPVTQHARLAPGAALVYYVTLDDRLLLWVATRTQWRLVVRPIGAAALTHRIDELCAAIQDDADFASITPIARALYDDVVAPAIQVSGSASTIYFIPDGPLHSLPFGMLPDGDGQPLSATRTIGIAASMASFQAASTRLATFSANDVLAIGDGHDPRTSALARLPMADAEAQAVGALYPSREVLTGSIATRGRMLASRRSVLHFAGHTIVNRRFPLFSQLLLAPDPSHGDDGLLLASDLVAHDVGRTQLAVLATCEAAAGRESIGDGMVSVVGAFLASGVPAVIASPLLVDDRVARRLFVSFHRELRQHDDPAAALRAAQLEVWRQGGNRLPVNAWGIFLAFGGRRPA